MFLKQQIFYIDIILPIVFSYSIGVCTLIEEEIVASLKRPSRPDSKSIESS